MKLIIQQNMINTISLNKIEAVTRDIPREFISVIPFTTEIICDKELLGQDYIPYGSCRFIELAYELGWKGLSFNENFNYKSCIENRNDMLNDDYIFKIAQAIDFLNSAKNQEFFIRPSNDLKYFSGQVMLGSEAWDFLTDALACESSGTYKLDESMDIVISYPKNIQMEWRYFIIDRKIVSGSIYRQHGQLILSEEKDPDVLKEAQTFADRWLPSDCVVMDLALVDGELKVIEFNCINGSGFYDHDISLVMQSLYNYHQERR